MPRTLKKSHFYRVFFRFFLRLAKLFKNLSSPRDLMEIKVGANDLSFPQVLSYPATFEPSDL